MPQQPLSVAEAGSGIRSFFTFLTGALILSAMMLLRWWQRVFLIISVVPIALLANAARVTGTGILAHTVGQHLAERFSHGFVGWIMLLLGAYAWCAEILLLGRLSDVEEGHT